MFLTSAFCSVCSVVVEGTEETDEKKWEKKTALQKWYNKLQQCIFINHAQLWFQLFIFQWRFQGK